MPTLKLTDAACQRLRVRPGERLEFFDATLPGFGLRVSAPTPRHPSGRKAWTLYYRIYGLLRHVTLGRYPALSLGAARQRTREIFQAVDRGEDPAIEQRAIKAEIHGPNTRSRTSSPNSRGGTWSARRARRATSPTPSAIS